MYVLIFLNGQKIFGSCWLTKLTIAIVMFKCHNSLQNNRPKKLGMDNIN